MDAARYSRRTSAGYGADSVLSMASSYGSVPRAPPEPTDDEDEGENRPLPRGGRRPKRHQETHEHRSLEWTKFTPYLNACLSAGGYHSAAIDEHGTLYTWGSGEYGQLGHGEGFHDQRTPMPVRNTPWPERVGAMQVSCGVYHTAIVTNDGYLWTCGYTGAGLGHGDFGNAEEPETMYVWAPRWVPLPNPSIRVRMVAAGWNHTVFCTRERGAVYVFGRGGEGRLGLGTAHDYQIPTLVDKIKDVPIKWVAAGKEHTGAVAQDGRLFMWGTGRAVGRGSEDAVFLPHHVDSLSDYHGERVAQVACGAGHTAALTEAGRLYTWGTGASGQLGHGYKGDELLPKEVDLQGMHASAVSTSAYHTVCVTRCGQVVSFGAGGRLLSATEGEDPDGEGGVSGEMGRLGYSGVEDANGGDRLDPRVVCGPWRLVHKSKPVHVAAGGYHTLFSSEGGDVFACGVALNGRLGMGDERDRVSPNRIPYLGPESPLRIRISPAVKDIMPQPVPLLIKAAESFENEIRKAEKAAAADARDKRLRAAHAAGIDPGTIQV